MFRRSGGFVTWFVEGKLPDPNSEELSEALQNHRFRSIENAASEELSVGWVSPVDPTGETFELESMDLDAGVWLRFRMDQKKVPATWMAIYRSEAERSAGRKLSAKERRELKEDITDRLLPRVLPSVKLVDALWQPKRSVVLLFGTSKNMREEFHKLFFRTFAVELAEAEPLNLAARVGLPRENASRLDELSPVSWPRERGARPIEIDMPASKPLPQAEDVPAEPPMDDAAELEEFANAEITVEGIDEAPHADPLAEEAMAEEAIAEESFAEVAVSSDAADTSIPDDETIEHENGEGEEAIG